MSMLNNNANPARVAKNFADKELQRTQNVRPDTMRGQFQPTIDRPESSLPSPDSIGAQAPQPASWIEGQNVQLQQERDRFNQADAAINSMRSAQEFENQQAVETSSATDSDSSLPSGKRQQILNETAKYAGSDYQLGGRTAKGIDCSGLVLSVYNKLGYNLDTHLVSGIRKEMPGVKTAVENLKPGDLVVWGDDSHIAIYAGEGMIWDASSSKGTTRRPLWGGKGQYGIAIQLPGD
jgi:cell wall-associated NlpC family hydrolase